MNLTVKRIERLRNKPGKYHDGHGLYLCVTNPTNISWKLRFERDGKERWHGLGPLYIVGLKAARERAAAARLLLLDGKDPIEKRKADKAEAKAAKAKALTFRDAAQQYYDQNSPSWSSDTHRDQFISSMRRFVLPVIGDLAVSDIDVAAVLRVLEQQLEADERFGLPAGTLWATRATTANRVRNRIEAVLGWSTVRGFRKGDNPAKWSNHLDNVLPARKAADIVHFAALPYTELPAFMIKLRSQESVAAQALEYLILTAARSAEVTGATWSEVDIENKIWTIPGSRMKGGKEHRVTLSTRAVALLKSAYRQKGNDHIFISNGSGLSRSVLPALLRRLRTGATVHGFRSSFSDWAHEQTAHASHTVELSLAHSVGNAVEQSYRRGPMLAKRRKLMEEWAAYCASRPVDAAANVVPIRAPSAST